MISQKTIFRAMLGYQSGILVGMMGGMTFIVFFSGISIWLRVFSAIGMVSASLGLLYSLWTTWQQYKNYLLTEKEMKDNPDMAAMMSSIEKSIKEQKLNNKTPVGVG